MAESTPTTPQPPEHIIQFFNYQHLPPKLQEVSAPFHFLAHDLVGKLPRNPERTVALRKLLEAKDAAVRALVAAAVLVAVAAMLICGLPSLALAAEALPAPTPTAGGMFLQTMLEPLVAAVVLVLGAAGTFFATWLRNKSAEASTSAGAKVAEQLGAKALEIMMAAVRATWASQRDLLASQVADGTITPEEAKKLRDATLSAFLAGMGDAFKAQLMGGLGLNESGLQTYAAGLLERAVGVVKVEKANEDMVKSAAKAQALEVERRQLASTAKTAGDLLTAAAGRPAQG